MSERVRERYYIDGSTVRKVREVPERIERPRQVPGQKTAPKQEKRITKKADRALAFDFRYTMFVMTSILIVACACLFMLHMESQISEQKNHINSMENELESLEDDNAALKLSLESMYSLD